jgi:hypothetical protein
MRRLLFITAITVTPLAACSKTEKADTSKYEVDLPEIGVDDVAAGIEAKTLTVVDCNGDRIRKRVGVLPGAILVADEETYPASILPADKSAKLVFYCGGPG